MNSKLKSCIAINDNLTQYFDCTIGTRQGCVGRPHIFSIFIIDLITYFKNNNNEHGIFVSNDINALSVLLFADDVSSFF